MQFAFLFLIVASFLLELFRSYPSWPWWVLLLFVFIGCLGEQRHTGVWHEEKKTTKEVAIPAAAEEKP